MTGFAITLVLAAAVIHATWNLLAKRAGGGAVFVWLYAASSTVLWAPITIPTLVRVWHALVLTDWVFLIGSGFIHMMYFVVLQKAYRAGDLSLVYPLARGTGPALSAAAAITLFGERPTTLALVGVLLIAASLFIFSTPAQNRGSSRMQAAFLSVITGILIAVYTVWDKHAVAARGIPPLVMEWFTSVTRVLLLLPLTLKNWGDVVHDWRTRRKYAIGIGALNPLAYLLVLIAMTFIPVSYVAPAREVSVLFGAFLGGRLLREVDRGRRMAAATVMVLGILLLSIG